MSDEVRFCVCGWSVRGSTVERHYAFRQHHESGQHAAYTRLNAERSAMAQVDAAVEAEIIAGSSQP